MKRSARLWSSLGVWKPLEFIITITVILGADLNLNLNLASISRPAWGRAESPERVSSIQQASQPLKISTPCSPDHEHVHIAVHLSARDPKIKSPKVRGQRLDHDALWLSAQLHEANALFAKLKICFWIEASTPLPSRDGVMKTRAQRTKLGRTSGRLERGRIDLFIVNRLNDVDIAGAQIRGVHWRDPKDRKGKRWIILSRIARPKVMAHELGHYFDLPHSTYPSSIMNKKSRKKPPMSARGFVKKEYAIMKRAWDRMKRTGHLKPMPRPL